MSIFDKVQIGNTVKVNLELSKDRLTRETFEAINTSPECTIIDFKITDGKGIGVIVNLSNGKKEWFFENEIEVLDQDGNVIEKKDIKNETKTLILDVLQKISYSPKNKIGELLNPINFIIWLLFSVKDIL